MPQGPLPKISLHAGNHTISHWLPYTEDGVDRFDLSAPYQRGSVWTLTQRQALIKSLYMGIPVGGVIVSKLPIKDERSPDYRVVDGKQRVEAVRAFVNNEVPVPAWWFRDEDLTNPTLRETDELITYSDLSTSMQRRFRSSSSLPAIEFDGQTEFLGRDADDKVIRRERSEVEILVVEAELYGLINFAGTAQTAEDAARAADVAVHPEEHS